MAPKSQKNLTQAAGDLIKAKTNQPSVAPAKPVKS